MAEYYAQRASAGLIISEATPVSPFGHGYPNTPGIYTSRQVAGWRRVTDAVHAQGGRIVLQLWHVGRISHQEYQPGRVAPVGPSAIASEGTARLPSGERVPFPVPRALGTEEVVGIVEQFRIGASNAMDAGFDGVEVHGANGYIFEQFLRKGSNQRQDRYGGSLENRARFLLETLEAVTKEWGPGRVGVRLSPNANYHGMMTEGAEETFSYVANRLNEFPLMYAHIMRALEADESKLVVNTPIAHYRSLYTGTLITNGRLSPADAEGYLIRGEADAVAFGKLFIANPDLPARIKLGGPYTAPDESTFYSSGPKGYTDYPKLT
jgi:N-ethylmaleimide reductase